MITAAALLLVLLRSFHLNSYNNYHWPCDFWFQGSTHVQSQRMTIPTITNVS